MNTGEDRTGGEKYGTSLAHHLAIQAKLEAQRVPVSGYDADGREMRTLCERCGRVTGPAWMSWTYTATGMVCGRCEREGEGFR